MQINSILQSHFGITDAAVTTLEGYDSTNYKIKSKKRIYVLKQNSYSEETLALLQAENDLFRQLDTLSNYEFPTAIPSLNEELIVIEEDQIFRLLSFIEGEFLGNITHTPPLLYSFGVFLAKMDNQIHKTYHPSIVGKETQWDLKNFQANYKYLKCIKNPKNRSLVDYFFLQFEEHVSPLAYDLRKGVIHNDGNDWNVLTKNGKISGIIDFGDMCHTWIISEVAIAITYVMMGKENPLEIASELIKGYHSIFPIEKKELDILYYLIAARLCTSVCNSAFTKTLKPDSEYITISEKPAWELLHKWISINPIKAKDSFWEAAGFKSSIKKTSAEQQQRRKANFSNALSLSYSNPIQMQQSAFQYM
ncbi:MAG: phosphotransferase, partial [Maribacter sp.]